MIWDTIYINVLSPFFATVIGVVIYNYTSAGYTTYACARSTVVCITILVPVLLYRGVSAILRHKMGRKNNEYGNSVRLRQPRHGVRASICEIEYQGVEVRYRGDENYRVEDEVTLTL